MNCGIKKLIICFLVFGSLPVIAVCPNILAKYELENMTKYCEAKTGGPYEIKIDYMIGDDAPMYSVLPETVNDESVAYIQPGVDLTVKSADGCKNFSIILPEKLRDGYIKRELMFKNSSTNRREVKAESEELLEENEKSTFTELRELTLSGTNENLFLNIRINYLHYKKKNSRRKLLRFEEFNCKFIKIFN